MMPFDGFVPPHERSYWEDADEQEGCTWPDYCRCDECYDEAYDQGELDEDEE